jgi:hypothetical protein
MKTRILLLVLCLGFILNGYAQTQAELLLKAYNVKSIELLNQFFENWSREIKPGTTTHINDTLKEIYNVYNTIYKPNQLDLVGGSEWGNSPYGTSVYYVLQPKLKEIYYSVDSIGDSLGIFVPLPTIPNPEDCDSIIPFYPPVYNTDKHVVYLTPAYQQLIDNFLGNSTTELGQGGVMNTPQAFDESERRKAFLEQVVKIYPHHWVRGKWLLYTYPVLGAIFFDKRMKKALVFYEIVYETNIAVLQKKDDTWEIVKARRFLIQ